MNYKGIDMPIFFKAYEEMTNKEAKVYFQWYISKIDERIQYLQDYIKNDGCSLELDFSPESLKSLWNWYIKKITIENKTEEELNEEYQQVPVIIREQM